MYIRTSLLEPHGLALLLSLLLILAAGVFQFSATNRLAGLSAQVRQVDENLAEVNRLSAATYRATLSARAAETPRDDRIGSARLRAVVDARVAAVDRTRRALVADYAAEQASLRRRQVGIEGQIAFANIMLGLAMVLALGTLVWLASARRRESGKWRQADQDLKGLNANLEDRVEAGAQEVVRTRDLLASVIENMPDTVYLKDARDDFRYIMINAAGESLLGMDRGRLLGNNDLELFPGPEGANFMKEDREVILTGKSFVAPAQSLSTQRGERIVERWKVPIFEADGMQHFVLGIVRDLTDKRGLEGQLRQIHRMDAVGHLTGGIAHDFNNILAIILGNVDLLREQQTQGSESADMADEALGAATHGVELVSRLLAFAGMQRLDPRPLDLNKRMPTVLALLRLTLGQNVRTEVRLTDGLWTALVDPTQVDDALINLAINARDAMSNGGLITIETSNQVLDEADVALDIDLTPGEYVVLTVSDTGEGMTSDVVARAFEPFFTTKSENSGSGLGLSQVYGWVKQSGGHTRIDSKPGIGTTIRIFLPRADEQATAIDPVPDSPDLGESGGNETILVVEDNPGVRATVLRQLSDLGYSAIEAHDGETAFDMVRNGCAFDLLMTDVMMPGGMTGYELVHKVRAIRPDLKALFTSGYAEPAASSAEFAKDGPLLSKPYRKHHLGMAVRAILDSD